ncbi:electron transfer flavoprotein [Martelella alba]|uniref:Electron transfer flavoprotein n=1 Tax=Martelella alba TaxID=2590451 RepID=A0ABY2SFC0_9HYPH|nr:electron transfer flavoprotein [Martelella alba]TKI02929.1 electron transfer flavoprotein [Martelella alba]
MKIITCFKLVPEEQDIVVTAERTLDFARANVQISQFDLNAVEAAVQLAGDSGQVAALSVGGAMLSNSKVRKDILSRGPQHLFLVQDAHLDRSLPNNTARALAAAASKIGFDLLLFGEGAGDLYAQQVGLLTGEILGLPTVNAVCSICVEGDRVRVERALEEEVEVLELPLPAVLCVTSDINVPKVPSMKAILGAGKKPVTQWGADDINWTAPSPLAELGDIRVPPQAERKHIIIEGDSPEAVGRLAEHLKKIVN